MTPEPVEQQLLALGDALAVPRAPDLVPAVIARLPARPDTRRRRAGRLLALALAATLLLAGVALAVPASRNAILRALGLRGVAIERVGRLPSLPSGTVKRLRLGTPIPLSRGRHAASFTALLPAAPANAYVAHDIPGGRISVLVGSVLIIEFRGNGTAFLLKMVGPGTTVRNVRVGADPGVYLSGAPHVVLFRTSNDNVGVDYVRLAGGVLIWQHGAVTLRMEGIRTLAQAVSLARSLR